MPRFDRPHDVLRYPVVVGDIDTAIAPFDPLFDTTNLAFIEYGARVSTAVRSAFWVTSVVVVVAFWAVVAALGHTVQAVIFMSTEHEMRRIAASSVVAGMHNQWCIFLCEHTWQPDVVMQLISEAMRFTELAVPRENAIAVPVNRSRPHPACRGHTDCDFRPEFFGGVPMIATCHG